jgi:undecaprenyl-diphosphatase
MNILEGIVLGIVQGVTEFLPVSSSGHLLLVSDLLGIEEQGITFSVLVHFATVLAVLVYFFKDIKQIFISTITSIFSFGKKEMKQEAWFGWLIVIATIPTGIIGVLFKDFFENLFGHSGYVGYMLLLTGLLLYVANKVASGTKTIKEVSFFDAVLIGLAQSIAILPGISRAGSTITMAIFRKLDRDLAARFSFILSIPVILGATLIEMTDLQGGVISVAYILGAISAFISAFFAIKIFMRILQKKRLDFFAYYCFSIGILSIVMQKVM